MTVFRVFPWDPNAPPQERGGALYVPPGGGGRIDNPDIYRVFYASSDAPGAVAETFGRLPMWARAMLVHPNASAYAIAAYELAANARLFELDDPAQLMALGLKPSDVVRRDLKRSQSWARTVHGFGRYDGISWWSTYGPQWRSIGIWDPSLVTLLRDPEPLTTAAPALREAATAIVRLIAK